MRPLILTIALTFTLISSCLGNYSAISHNCGSLFHEDVVESSDKSLMVDGSFSLDSIFPIGTKWTYDFSWKIPGGPFGQDSLLLGTYEITITDTFSRNDSLVYVLNTNRFNNHEEWMYQDGRQIYFWKGEDVKWQLTYNFEADSFYSTRFFNPWINDTDIAKVDVNIDPLQSIEFGARGLQTVQSLSIDNNGTYENMPVTADILHNCGKLNGGLSLGLGWALADPPYVIGDLRCFEQGSFIFNFTGEESDPFYIACDSVKYYGTNTSQNLTVDPIKIWYTLESVFGKNIGMFRSKFDTIQTVLDDRNYHELLRSFEPDENEWEGTNVFFAQEGNKIYHYNDSRDTSIVVYDYSLEEGDVFNDFYSGNIMSVEKVDSFELLSGQKVKQIAFEDCVDLKWIEGWGSRGFGLMHFDYNCTWDLWYLMTCGVEDGITQISNLDSCWFFGIGTGLPSINENANYIYPNPATDQIIINSGSKTFSSFKIYNVNGILVAQGEYKEVIDISHLPKGMMLLQLDNDVGTMQYFLKQ